MSINEIIFCLLLLHEFLVLYVKAKSFFVLFVKDTALLNQVIPNLFLSLFRCCLFCLSTKHKAFVKVYTLQMQNDIMKRKLEQHNLRPNIETWEKVVVHECATINEKVTRHFSLVTPETILKAWKYICAKLWTYKNKNKSRKPRVTKETRELVFKMKLDNSTWGLRRIRDELLKLGIELSHEAISRILKFYRDRGDFKPNGSWSKFLSSHWKSLFSCDFFTSTIVFGLTTYYIFFIMKLETREIVTYGVTTNPNKRFLKNCFLDFEEEYPGATLIHDNSSELKWFPYEWYNIKGVSTLPYSPNMNAYAERFVRSVRQECLDHLIIFTDWQLRNVIREYIKYYNNYRPHQGLKGIPKGLPAECSKTGEIKKKELLYGLHHHYYRETA
jgi:hypothetical protein